MRPVSAEGVVWGEHTQPVPPDIEELAGLVLAADNPAPEATFFAITDYTHIGNVVMVSVAALGSGNPTVWTLYNAVWIGTLALSGGSGAVEGSPEYQQITDGVVFRSLPEIVPDDGPGGDDGFDSTLPVLPFKGGTVVTFGPRGVHDAGYSLTGWKAVDLVSGSDLGSRYAPNEVYASEDAQISFVCRDSTSVAIKAGNFLYAHLRDTSNLATGTQLYRGVKFATMVVGSFTDSCGWAQQQPNHWHLHWGFDGLSTIDLVGWTLYPFSEKFVRGSEEVAANGALMNYGTPGSDPGSSNPDIHMTGANFWDGLVGGMLSFVKDNILPRFPQRTDTDYGGVYTNAAGVVMRVFFIILASNFKLHVFAFVVLAMFILEPTRMAVKLYMTIKKGIPFVG